MTLALDLYMRRGLVSQSDPELVELSKLLNTLRGQGGVPDAERYRNPNGVHMKLGNFRAQHLPGQGLQHGNQLEPAVWERFANDPDLLAAEVVRIKATSAKAATTPLDPKSR